MKVIKERSKIYMLPTDKPTGIFKLNTGLAYSIMDKVRTNHEGFHIYFTTDEEIKVGDHYTNGRYIFICDNLNDVDPINYNYLKKIVATNDKSLCLINDGIAYAALREKRNKLRDLYNTSTTRNDYLPQIKAMDDRLSSWEKRLPQPSDEFIQKYCDEGGIDEVDIECALYFTDECERMEGLNDGDNIKAESRIKVDSHNTITIHPIKNSWNREELMVLIDQVESDLHDEVGDDFEYNGVSHFITNLKTGLKN
jgi:hypothetical protein